MNKRNSLLQQFRKYLSVKTEVHELEKAERSCSSCGNVDQVRSYRARRKSLQTGLRVLKTKIDTDLLAFKNRAGTIELICGPMFGGKTTRLIIRVKDAEAEGSRVQTFKHKNDRRYVRTDVISHDGLSIKAKPIRNASEIIQALKSSTNIVAIDEVQFFDSSIVDLCIFLARLGLRVIVAGVELDFRAKPFGPMALLMAEADSIDKVLTRCAVCGRPANRTQRLVKGSPASYHDPVIMIGAADIYEPRCRRCHRVAGTT